MSLNDFIDGLPKAELHLHIEGSLEPEQMFEFAKRNNVPLKYNSVDEIRGAYNFSNLQDFLDLYYQGMSVLQTREDFYELTYAYLTRVNADSCRHVEIFFDPQGHTERGIAFADIISGISDALKAGERDYDISYSLIMSFLRHLTEESAFETLAQVEPFLDLIDGVGLDSSEMGHPPSKFERVFAAAADMGLKRVAHAGEEGPPAYVWEAINLLKIDRIDHGNRALEDAKLVEKLAQDQTVLTVCPLSNLRLCVVLEMEKHPLKMMLGLGLKATVNSDDPSYFGGYINDNFKSVAGAVGLSKQELIQLARNSFTGAFLGEERKATLLAELDNYVRTMS